MTLKFEKYSLEDIQKETLRAKVTVEQKRVLLDKLGGYRDTFGRISEVSGALGDVGHVTQRNYVTLKRL